MSFNDVGPNGQVGICPFFDSAAEQVNTWT